MWQCFAFISRITVLEYPGKQLIQQSLEWFGNSGTNTSHLTVNTAISGRNSGGLDIRGAWEDGYLCAICKTYDKTHGQLWNKRIVHSAEETSLLPKGARQVIEIKINVNLAYLYFKTKIILFQYILKKSSYWKIFKNEDDISTVNLIYQVNHEKKYYFC